MIFLPYCHFLSTAHIHDRSSWHKFLRAYRSERYCRELNNLRPLFTTIFWHLCNSNDDIFTEMSHHVGPMVIWMRSGASGHLILSKIFLKYVWHSECGVRLFGLREMNLRFKEFWGWMPIFFNNRVEFLFFKNVVGWIFYLKRKNSEKM